MKVKEFNVSDHPASRVGDVIICKAPPQFNTAKGADSVAFGFNEFGRPSMFVKNGDEWIEENPVKRLYYIVKSIEGDTITAELDENYENNS